MEQYMDQEYQKAKNQTLRYLSYRERSEAEVKNYLNQKGYHSSVIERVISRMKELNYLNDHRFTELWVKNRANSGKRGSGFVKKELIDKGISLTLIEDIMEAEYDPEREYEIAYEQACKRLKSYQSKPEKLKIRLWRFLEGRGFHQQTIKKVLKRILDEEIHN